MAKYVVGQTPAGRWAKAVGEAISMLVGGVTIYLFQKKTDFTK